MKLLDSDDLRWTLLTAGSTLLAASVLRKATERGWRAVRGHEPPPDPLDDEVGWVDVVAWAGLSAASAAVARVVARRLAEGGWRRWTGEEPPD